MNNDECTALSKKYILPTYSRIPIALVKGEGSYVCDADGNRYLDFVSGIAVTNQGHCHPKVVAAIKKQADSLIHCSNLFEIPNQALLAERLCLASEMDKAFFCNSGTEANEAAIKLARKWGKLFKNGAYKILVGEGSFHGRTMGSLSATAQKKYQGDFTPLLPGFQTIPFGDFEALRNAIGPETAGIMLEPVQGEGGVNVPPPGYLKTASDLAEKEKVLLILDEVQTGIGRTGKMFAHQHHGVKPDILTLAKALGGGVPIGAMLASKRAAVAFGPGDHAATFGGNPLSTAAALAALEVVQEGLVQNCREMGAYFKECLKELESRWPFIVGVRGLGLLLGMELTVPAAPFVEAARKRGLLILTAGQKVLRFLPPLTVTKQEVNHALGILEQSCRDCLLQS